MTPEQWALTIGSGVAVLGGIGTIVKMLLDHSAGVRSREGDAEERHMARLEKRIEQLEATQHRLEAILRRRDAYVAALLVWAAAHGDGTPLPDPPMDPAAAR